MNKYLFMLLLFAGNIYSQQQYSVKITNIDSTKSYYFIKGRSNEIPKKKILIISERDSTFNKCSKIQKNATYLLTLDGFFSETEKNGFPAKPKTTFFLRIDGYIVWDGKYNLPYKSVNIKSLCFINNKF